MPSQSTSYDGTIILSIVLCVACLLPTRLLSAELNTETLLAQLNSRKPVEVEAALQQLAKVSSTLEDNPSYRQRLSELVLDKRRPESIRELSAMGLGCLGSHAAMQLSSLERVTVKDPSWRVRRAATEALGKIGVVAPDVINNLKEAGHDLHPKVRIASIEAFVRLEPQSAAIQRLISVLEGPEDVLVRRSAAYDLGRIGPAAAPAVNSLARILEGENDNALKEVTAWALGLIGPAAVSGELALVHRLNDAAPEIRRVAADALSHIGSDQSFVLEALTRSFETEPDQQVKIAMALALAEIGRSPRVANAFFVALRTSQDSTLQQAAATGLSRVIPPANADVGVLVPVAHSNYPDVRVAAINAIGHIHQQPDRVIPTLVSALKDPMPSVQLASAEALGEFREVGGSGASALKGLTLSLSNEVTRLVAVRSMGHLADALRIHIQDFRGKRQAEIISALGGATAAVDDLKNTDDNNFDLDDSSRNLHQALTAFSTQQRIQMVRDWLAAHRWATNFLLILVIYLIWVAVLYLLVLRLAPQALIGWNDFLDRLGTVTIPGLGQFAIKLNYLLLGGLHQHHKVLTAWIEGRAETVRINFMANFRGFRGIYYPLPVTVSGKIINELTPQTLREVCGQNKFLFRILGEGGVGKTTLACQIGLWAIEKEPSKRVFPDRRMLPVLLQRLGGLDTVEKFHREVKGQLQDLVGEAKSIPDWLCRRLLEDKRLLVILDGLSEVASLPDSSLPLQPDFGVAALVITSRSEHLWSDVTHVDVKPLRIDSDHLSPFINAYLANTVKLPDTELFEACRRLAALVGRRSITPLLARMYAEQLSNALPRKLPENIPDLVVGYVEVLNRTHKADDPEQSAVHGAAKLAAWVCCKKTLTAGSAKKEEVEKAFESKSLNCQLLKYLEQRLGLVRTIPPANVDVEFLLDPLAEYLAALWLIHSHKGEGDWKSFFRSLARSNYAPASKADFLTALRDCYSQITGDPESTRDVLSEIDMQIERSRRTEPCAVAGSNATISD